jgi:hypothetical protein
MGTETMSVENATEVAEDGRLTIAYSGGLADSGALLLSEYSASLHGWRDLMQVLGELYLHSFPELRRVRGNELLRIEVVAENKGSYETILAFAFGAVAGGILGNRADAAVVWSFAKLIEWYQRVIRGYVRAKSHTTDVTAIAAALESMAAEAGIPLQHADPGDDAPPLFEVPGSPDQATDEEERPSGTPANRARALAEIIDQALQKATQPLAHSCERVKVFEEHRAPLLEIGPAERAIIVEPLTLPPPRRDWRAARIKFERITLTARLAVHCSHSRMNRSPTRLRTILGSQIRRSAPQRIRIRKLLTKTDRSTSGYAR